jgi:hypothetical protein
MNQKYDIYYMQKYDICLGNSKVTLSIQLQSMKNGHLSRVSSNNVWCKLSNRRLLSAIYGSNGTWIAVHSPSLLQ